MKDEAEDGEDLKRGGAGEEEVEADVGCKIIVDLHQIFSFQYSEIVPDSSILWGRRHGKGGVIFCTFITAMFSTPPE